MSTAGQKKSSLMIRGPSGLIEARLTDADDGGFLSAMNAVAIVCHPHPLHGGTMDNKVVTTLERTYRDLGVTVLCFNFRGVGASEGVFDNAQGEVDDLLAVITWVGEHYSQAALMLAGFSFGSSIAAQASYCADRLVHLLLVAPPIERYSYDRNKIFPCALCVVQGNRDERVVAEDVHAWFDSLKSPAELLRYEDAGHFFHGYLALLKKDLSEVLQRQLKQNGK